MFGRSKPRNWRACGLQPLDDVGPRQRIGGGGERDARHAGNVRQRSGAVLGRSGPIGSRNGPRRSRTGQLAALPERIEFADRKRGVLTRAHGSVISPRSMRFDVLRLAPPSRVSNWRKAASTPASCSAPDSTCISAIGGDTPPLLRCGPGAGARWRGSGSTRLSPPVGISAPSPLPRRGSTIACWGTAELSSRRSREGSVQARAWDSGAWDDKRGSLGRAGLSPRRCSAIR